MDSNGTFTSRNDSTFDDLIAMGVEVTPLGNVDNAILKAGNEDLLADAAKAAAQAVLAHNWSGLVVDDEQMASTSSPDMYAKFIGYMSTELDNIGRRFVVDVCSTWHGDIVGPENLAAYANAPGAPALMDMATYFGFAVPSGTTHGVPTPRTFADLQNVVNGLLDKIPTAQIAIGVGLTGPPSAANASCGGWPQCTNMTDPACSCYE